MSAKKRSSRMLGGWNAALIAVALLFGLTCILPNILQRVDADFPFQGVELMGTDQEFYASRIREVQDGNVWIGDVYYSDLKHDPYVQPPLPEWIQGGIGVMLGLSIGHTVLFSKFLFGALLFASVTLFAARLFGRPWAALLGVTAALFALFLFSSVSTVLSVLSVEPIANSVARFSRLTNPQVSIIPFFLALWFFMGWRSTRRTAPLVWAGVLTGLSFYAYMYTWTYLGSVFAVLTITAVIRRDWRELKAMALLLSVILLVAAPYLFHLAQTVSHPGYGDLAMRIGMVASHRPLWGTWAVVLLVLGVVLGKTLSPAHRPVLIALGIGAFLTLNQQVFTGRALVPHHYHWYFIHPLAVITFVVAVSIGVHALSAKVRSSAAMRATYVVLLATAIFFGVMFQVQAYGVLRSEWGEQQHRSGILRFLDDDAYNNLSVYAPGTLADALTVYTPVDVVYAVNTSNCCLTPLSRLRHVYFFEEWLAGLRTQDALAQFSGPKREDVSRRLYGIYYREKTGTYAGIPDAEIASAATAYVQYAALPLCEKLGLQPFDFFVWPKNEALPAAARSLTAGSVILYQDAFFTLWDVRNRCDAR